MTQHCAPSPCAPQPTCSSPPPQHCSPTPEPCTPHDTWCQSQSQSCGDYSGCEGHSGVSIGLDLEVHATLDFGHDCGPTFA